ncbi:HAD family hydrolase [Desulfobotulus sp.]|uniref:HAD family hydrolase n=1 Tax=Desulfobotulus sp. TaxID=1940337 RepID=UPI002A3723CE|nr:HAD family hydrolase [Desulfobotulus sp.]MDY0164475.1 HAD family hydrolase [Desulfobotulus sp.]
MAFLQDISVIAFDCDGVMFDSTEVNRSYYNQLLEAFDLPLMDDAAFHYVHMHTAEGAIRHLFEGRVPLEAVREKQRAFHYPDLFPLMREEPHLRALLRFLKPKFRTAVATNRSNTLRPLLDHFDLTTYFDLLVTSLDVPRPKPWPDMLEAIVRRFGVRPENLLYIGDSPLDAQAAAAAGCVFVGYGPEDLGASLHIRRLDVVATWLEGGGEGEGKPPSFFR